MKLVFRLMCRNGLLSCVKQVTKLYPTFKPISVKLITCINLHTEMSNVVTSYFRYDAIS